MAGAAELNNWLLRIDILKAEERVNPQLVSSATVNSLILTTIVFATILSAMVLGIWSGYVTVSGILRAMNRRPAKASATIIEFPANAAS